MHRDVKARAMKPQTCCSRGLMHRQNPSMGSPGFRKQHLHPALPCTLCDNLRLLIAFIFSSHFMTSVDTQYISSLYFPPPVNWFKFGWCTWQRWDWEERDVDDRRCCCISLFSKGNVAKNWAVWCFILLIIRRHHQTYANEEHNENVLK